MTPRSASPPITQADLQAQMWALLKWILGVGIPLVFAIAVWATTLKAQVTEANTKIETIQVKGTDVGLRVARQVDSLSIEMRHMGERQEEILILLRSRR